MDASSIFAFQSVNQSNDKVNIYLCNHIRDLSDVYCYDPTNNNDYDISYDANISDENQDKVIWRALATEMDNHADTHFFGANFLPI